MRIQQELRRKLFFLTLRGDDAVTEIERTICDSVWEVVVVRDLAQLACRNRHGNTAVALDFSLGIKVPYAL